LEQALLPVSAHGPRNWVNKSIKVPQVIPTKSKIDIWCWTSFLSCINTI